MATFRYRIVCVLLFCLGNLVAVPQARLEKIYTGQIGVREKTGHNDGPAVEMYLRSVGLNKGFAWCAAFVHWCLVQADIKNNVRGAAASARNNDDLVLYRHKFLQEPRAGDVFTLWFNSMHGEHHTGFFDRKINSSVFASVEGNTNEQGSREGDGVYKKYRSFNATYSISRWP